MAIGAVQVETLKKGKSARRLIFIKKDPETGLEEESEELGEDAVQTLITLTTDQAVKISNEVKRILSEKKSDVDQIKNALSSTTKAEQDYIKEKYGGIGSVQNKQLMAGTKQALEILATL
jgi:diphthamide synthase subunit DPH2